VPNLRGSLLKRGSLEKLVSSGFSFSRKKEPLIHAALDGCDFCRELLCMPYKCVRRTANPTHCAWHWDREAKGGPVWPIAHWKTLLAARTGKKKYKFAFSPVAAAYEGLFRLSRGSKLSGRLVKMLFHISVEHGTNYYDEVRILSCADVKQVILCETRLCYRAPAEILKTQRHIRY
jgi:hypothetical protein